MLVLPTHGFVHMPRKQQRRGYATTYAHRRGIASCIAGSANFFSINAFGVL
jgi:hypothetical protein